MILTTCTALPEGQAATGHRPQALLDAYLVAHGMAASYVESPDANPAVVEQLRTLDMRAAAALRSLGRPSGADMATTANAVAALTNFAAAQSTAADQ
jgi:hypothetical protein